MILPFMAVNTGIIIMIVVIVLLLAGTIALAIWGKKLQKQQDESRQQLEAAKQSVKLLVIDKKRMKLKDAGLPQAVLDQTPKRFRNQKLPIVKAKVGPQITSLICDENIFDLIPVKKEVRASVSGLYILEVKGIRSSLEAKGKKLTFREKISAKAKSLSGQIASKSSEDKSKK